MFDVTKCAAQEAIIDLGVAFRGFFEKRGAYPGFKKKGVDDSFCAANEVGTFRCDGRRIQLPVVGWLRMREAVRFSGTLKRVTVSREADRWFASILVETADIPPVVHPQEVVGVDLGPHQLAVLSDGAAIRGPKAHTACGNGCGGQAEPTRASHVVPATPPRRSGGWHGCTHGCPGQKRRDPQGDDAAGENLPAHRD